MILFKQQILDDVQGICLVPYIPIRANPAEQAEMTSQLLFGEGYRVLETLERWVRIVALQDNYTGWIDRKLFVEFPHGLNAPGKMPVLFSVLARITKPDGTSMIISGGSNLPLFDENDGSVVIANEKLKVESFGGELLKKSGAPVYDTACRFLNVPYLWGGKSAFGFDCSGLAQTAFKMNGYPVPKDTDLQVTAGTEVTEPVPDDLAFFADEKSQVTHVGIVMPRGKIVHCSGMVRIDDLDEKGIYDRQKSAYTHRLHSFRRIK